MMWSVRLFGLLLACAATLAPAQNANEQARQLAKRLGSERSAEGLQTIVDSRNRELLEWYARGANETSMREKDVALPAPIEAVIVNGYRDPEVGATLRNILHLYTPYRTRELFDLMLEEWRSGRERNTGRAIRDVIFATKQPGIEPPVFAWLNETPGPNEYDANAIMRFLAERKYAPAVPAIARRQRVTPSTSGLMYTDWLLAIGTPEAVNAVIARIAFLREQNAGVEERMYTADRLASLPESAHLDLDAFRAALGPGALDDPRFRSSKLLLEDPRKYYAQRGSFAREGEIARKRMELGKPLAEAWRSRESQPQRYADALQEYIDGLTALAEANRELPSTRGLREEIGNSWLKLGNFTRFRLQHPRPALEDYASAERAGNGLAIFLQADTWQFSLRDKARALAEYRRNLAKLESTTAISNRDEAAFVEWARRWLRHQVAFLETGKTFSGAIGREDAAGVGLFVFLGSAAASPDDDLGLMPLYEKIWGPGRTGSVDRREVARQLEALPSSGWMLMRTAGLVAHLPDARSVLAYLARNDPAGYATACYFGLMEQMERGPPEMREGMMGRAATEMFGDMQVLKEARARFVRERRVIFTP